MIKTKIVCTIGPASREPETLRKLVRAGMNVARLNFSHGDQTFHRENIDRIRQISNELDIPVAILIDLQGPKLRIGNMGKDGIQVLAGEKIILTNRPIVGHRPAESDRPPEVPVQYASLPLEVHKNDHIFIDDGLLELVVLRTGDNDIFCEVISGGNLKSNKGLNLPNAALSIPSITEKDWDDLKFALSAGADWIALSFVRSANDVIRIKERIAELSEFGRPVPLISKIEKPEALTVIDAIIEHSDGIMIARGDLGIEIAPEKVPMVQKMIINKCNAARIPVITATQMLDSMIRNPRPTRAEASDVANAILDGTDAVMLSGETAAGQYPLESVKTMVSIAREVESQQNKQWIVPPYIHRPISSVTDAVSHATCETANDLNATAIISATASGSTAMAVARYRPISLIIAVTPSPMVQRRLLLVHGVFPLLGKRKASTDEMLDGAIEAAVQSGLIKRGDTVIITAGISPNMPGSTDLMKVETIPEILASGTGVSGKIVQGRVRHVSIPPDTLDIDIDPDDILVVEQSHRSLIPLARRAAALISQEGGTDCHAFTLAMELGITAIVGVNNALSVLTDGMEITLDSEHGYIYAGKRMD
ncbi:MAG: pyruvate kinase [Anaerolineales bacterium]|nr:pyruvate kinase [Anaerolineales bacterium]